MELAIENNSVQSDNISREKLVGDLKVVAKDAEELIKATAGDLGERAKAARARLTVALENAKETGAQIQQKAIERAKATDQAIHENPYPVIGVAFGVGLLVGFLLGRK
jgi:ElaB/YqjD/DUF883 family membrane-anchored ribosome-binding protein